MKKKSMFIAFCLTMCMIFLLFGCKAIGGKSIALSDYCIVSVEGLSTRADAKIYLDKDGVYSKLAGIDSTADEREKYKPFVDSISCSLDKYEDVANGDRLIINISYDNIVAKELNIDVTSFVSAYDVADLPVGTQIDVFKDLEIIVSGVAPYGFVTYVNNSQDEYIKNLTYELSGSLDGVKNGDVINIKCNLDPKTAELYYYYTDVTSMSYVVDGLDSYIYDENDLDREVLSDIATECSKVIDDITEDTTTRILYTLTDNSNYLYQDNHEWVDSLKLSKVIFMPKHENVVAVDENIILFVFEGTISNNNYSEYGYFIFRYENAIKTAKGEYKMGRNNPELRYVCGVDYDALYNELVRDYIGKYDSIIVDGVTMTR